MMNPKPLPKEVLCEIGALILTASAVDHHVGLQILRMISPNNFVMWHAWPVVCGMDFKVKLSLIRILAAQFGKETRDYCSECCDEMQKLYQKRNIIAHSLYQGPTPKGHFQFQDMRADPQTGVTKQPLNVDIETIHNWGWNLLKWSNELERSLSDLGYPLDGPTVDDIEDRGPAKETEEHHPGLPIPRASRKKPKPPSR